jgi:hypothetical protein
MRTPFGSFLVCCLAFAACSGSGSGGSTDSGSNTGRGGSTGSGGFLGPTGGAVGSGGTAAGTGGSGPGGAGAPPGPGGTSGGTGGANTGAVGGSATSDGGSVTPTGGSTASGGVSGAGGTISGGGGAAGSTGVVSLFDGTTLSGWLPSSIAAPYSKNDPYGNAPGTWDVQDAALHCTGKVRGVLVSPKDYGSFRLIFWVRQLPATGTDNHYASFLIWGSRVLPQPDAIAGVQFGVPNGYFWDYRVGHNDANAAAFVSTSGGFSRTDWAQCEILANHTTGVALMACCNPGTATSCKAKQVLKFTDPTVSKTGPGPIAMQAHSVGGHDEYKNITIEENPTVDTLITTQ